MVGSVRRSVRAGWHTIRGPEGAWVETGRSNPAIEAIVMTGLKAVKPDPSLWLPLLDGYELTSLPRDTVLRGSLRPGLTPESREVREMLDEWPASAYLDQGVTGTDIVLVYQIKDDPPATPMVHGLLLFLTLITTLGSGALMLGVDPFDTEMFRFLGVSLPYPTAFRVSDLLVGAAFAIPFLLVLLVHEMGHYVAARAHRVRVSLPYFIPFPPYLSVIGSLGAFIRLKGPTVRRSVMFDIGASGPFASFVIAFPMFIVGLGLSEPVPGPVSLESPFLVYFFGQPLLLGSSPLVWGLAEVFGPMAFGERLLLLHPLALAGWLGFFVTALNLLPLGQLDGGHVLYSIAPRLNGTVARIFMLCLVPLGLLWWGWWGWMILIFVLHRGKVAHPSVVQPGPDPGTTRQILGIALIVIFFLTFVPVPIEL